jgi:hypothetical protein
MNNPLDGALGVLFLYLALAGVGLVDVALFRSLTADYLMQFQRNERGVLARGVLTVLGAVLLVVLLNAVAQNSPPDVPARGVIPLLVALVLLLLALALLLGYGALAWRLGERVLISFGVAAPNPGWSVLVATLLVLSVVWIPVFGWALGLYWAVIAIGAVMQRLMSSPEEPMVGTPREPSE